MLRRLLPLALLLVPLSAHAAGGGVAAVDDARLREANSEPQNWLTHGRTYAEQRFSPLAQITADNIGQLVRVWRYDTQQKRGHEATPIVVDGVLYATGAWSVVFALDAKTGEELWRFDPEVPKEVGVKACCDVVNRGVAVYEGKVFFGTLDGRLFALDAKTGKPVWNIVTVDQSKAYTITGAPRVVKGKVIIGNGGAEFGVRGYVSAYDSKDGKLVWRTFTVPGNPEDGFESKAMEEAAKTWSGGEWWKIGGGGTVWDSMAFDPDLNLLYVGTGNGSPWSRTHRSPGGGDNLYLSSILALDPDTGEQRWHFQTTPGDNWDFTATQQMILADLEIDGKQRQVIMQAPKNGYFWVLDRKSGEFISAKPYVEVTWSDGVDPKTGRPKESGTGDYDENIAIVKPTFFGGHNWQSMSFNPKTGLVYIPAQEILGAYRINPKDVFTGKHTYTETDLAALATLVREVVSGHLLAWDPVKQEEAWRHPYAMPWNGGTLTTAGDLVFQGTADGRFIAFRASDGRQLWEFHTGNGIIAAPVTYAVDGTQYVSIVVGWGGAFALVGGDTAGQAGNTPSNGAVYTFALSTQAITSDVVEAMLGSRGRELTEKEDLYHRWCARCHGAGAVSGGALVDLRDSSPDMKKAFVEIVQKGMPGVGMPSFGEVLSREEIEQIRAYVLGRPN